MQRVFKGTGLSLLKVALSPLASAKLAILLMIIITLACAVGSLVPQEPLEPEAARERWGETLGALIIFCRLNDLYRSPLFLALVALLLLNTALCTATRFRPTTRGIAMLLAHLGVLLIGAGAWIGFALNERGFLHMKPGESYDQFLSHPPLTQRRIIPLGFRIRLDSFRIVRHEPNVGWLLARVKGRGVTERLPVRKEITQNIPGTPYHIQILDLYPNWRMENGAVISVGEEMKNPALLVRIAGRESAESPEPASRERWVFARYPELYAALYPKEPVHLIYDRPVKSFVAEISVLDLASRELRKEKIEVNHPLRHGEFTVHLAGYDERDETLVQLEVVKEHGVRLVCAGFLLLACGILFAFYIRPLLDRRAAVRSERTA